MCSLDFDVIQQNHANAHARHAEVFACTHAGAVGPSAKPTFLVVGKLACIAYPLHICSKPTLHTISMLHTCYPYLASYLGVIHRVTLHRLLLGPHCLTTSESIVVRDAVGFQHGERILIGSVTVIVCTRKCVEQGEENAEVYTTR